jgi:YfiH family protein
MDQLIFMHQTHSDQVLVVDGSEGEPQCDALVTRSKGVALAAMAADCMPVTFTSDGVVGIAHVGRVGLVKGIAQRTVETMLGLGAGKITAIIGPSICARCYEVSPDMYEEISTLIPSTATSSELHSLDLKSGVKSQLESLGVTVKDVGICTLENSDYFSFRGGDLSARQAGIISL